MTKNVSLFRYGAIFLAVILEFFLMVHPAYAYIYQITIWKNKQNGKFLYTASDIHRLGKKSENIEQMDFFIENVLNNFERKSINLNVLLESQEIYYVDINKMKRSDLSKMYNGMNTVCTQYFCNVDKQMKEISLSNPNNLNSHWLSDLIPEVKLNREKLHHISFESVDPRLATLFWMPPCLTDFSSFSHIFDLGNDIQELEEHLEKTLNDPLSNELRKIDEEIKADKIKVLAQINKGLHDERVLNSQRLGPLIEKGMLSVDDVQKVHDHINAGEGSPSQLRSLDRVALWKIANNNSIEHTFLIVGGLHTDHLSEHLRALGYDQIEQFGKSFEELQESVMVDPENNHLGLVPSVLKNDIERGFLKIGSIYSKGL